MIFYLTPAFFVDVTDGWRLPDRRQRVAIALAGPAVHAAVAAVALLVALALPDTEVRQTLVLLALDCAAIVLVNLIPFVRFDGYIALMSALDEPNLRARTIRDGANSLTRFLFGGQKAAKSLNTWWSVPFGLASLLAPVVLVLFAVGRRLERSPAADRSSVCSWSPWKPSWSSSASSSSRGHCTAPSGQVCRDCGSSPSSPHWSRPSRSQES